MKRLGSDRYGKYRYSQFVLIVTTGLLLFSGCKDQTAKDQAENDQTEEDMAAAKTSEPVEFTEVFPFETLGIGQSAAFTDPVERMIYDGESWATASSSLTPHQPFEPVDFSQVMLALIAIPATSGGYSVEVESVELVSGVLTIAYLLSEPGVDCITPQALAVPFQVIEIRKVEGEVNFQQRKDQISCEDF